MNARRPLQTPLSRLILILGTIKTLAALAAAYMRLRAVMEKQILGIVDGSGSDQCKV